MSQKRNALLAAAALCAIAPGACERAQTREDASAAQTAATAGESPSVLMEQRAMAMIEALSAGDATAYEAAAQENYTAEFLAARSPEDRAEFVAMIANDFGALEVRDISDDDGVLSVSVAGARGPVADFVFIFDETPQRRIERIEINAEAGGGEMEAGPGVPAPAMNAGMSTEAMGEALDQWLAPYLDHEDFSGVIIIAHDGAPYVERAHGLADRDADAPNDLQTRFNIASIGKAFTKTAIARLIEDGLLSPDTTIGEVMPDYPQDETRAATIRQLIDMEAGVSDFFSPEFEAADKSAFASNHNYYSFVAARRPSFAPGEDREYCNGCYVVLGEIVERLSGEPFEDFVARTVFAPAGMTRSGYFNAADLPNGAARIYGRSDGPDTPYVTVQDQHGNAGSGAGGAYSTALDLLAFDNALREGKILGPEMTAFVLGGGGASGERNMTPLGVAGGAPGVSALMESNGEWAVIVTANVSEPLPEQIGLALARAIIR
ncbi:MAG: serine hydrolase domain-containing protein [Parvularculaceae bacterium]|nr:beta-lactamase family protein [Parvularculaceae bacterium]